MSDSNKTVVPVEENVATVAQATETPKCKGVRDGMPGRNRRRGKCLRLLSRGKATTSPAADAAGQG